MTGRLDGKVALVTGGASGIGAETSRVYAREGAKVAIADVNDNMGRRLSDEIGDAAFYVHLDTRAEDEWQTVVKQVVDTYGRLDILVNSAGVPGRRRDGTGAPNIEAQHLEDWNRVMDVNSTGIFLGMKTAIPEMRKSRGGSIINMSSVLGITGDAVMAAYCATKGAVRLFSKAVALESAEGGWGIRVNSVHPAFIRTPMVDRYAETFETTDAGYAELGRRQPMGRVGEAVEVANAVLYLASEEASFVTGTELVVDGGYTAR